MLKRISTIDYGSTEFINLEGDTIELEPNKFERVLDIVKKLTYYFGTNNYIELPTPDIDSFIINLSIDEYQLEFYAEKTNKNFGCLNNSVQNIYKDGILVAEDIARKNYEDYSIIADFATRLNWLTKNLFGGSNIEHSLFNIKNRYSFDPFNILNKFLPEFFDNLDYINTTGVYTKSGHRFNVDDQGSGFLSYINLIPMMCEAIRTDSTVLLDRYTSFHPILKKAIFENLWKEKVLHKLMKESDSKGQIIMREY